VNQPPEIVHPSPDDAPTRAARRQRSIASTFHRSDLNEEFLALRARADRGDEVAAARLDAIDPATRTAHGYYVESRAAAVAEDLIDPTTGERR
jgi:hypothetical protein